MILGPDTKATLKLATLVSAICFTVSATIFLWTIKENGEKALAEIKELRQDWKGSLPHTHIRSTASGGTMSRGLP